MAELETTPVGDEYLKVVVRERGRAGLADEVRAMFPDAVDVVVAPPDGARDAAGERPTRRGRSPHELFGEYLAEQAVDDRRLVTLFSELLEDAGAT